LVTAVAQGDAEISATYQSVRGTMGVGVRPVPCPVSLSPATATFGPFGGSGSVQVLVGAASCRWSARSDAPWLPFAFEPAAPGSAIFSYTAPANSTTEARTALPRRPRAKRCTRSPSIARRGAAGDDPEEAVFRPPAAGRFRHHGQQLPVEPRERPGVARRPITRVSAEPRRAVRYSVQAHTRDVDADGYLEIAGLSGQNPTDATTSSSRS
jgi:hypothetical protein